MPEEHNITMLKYVEEKSELTLVPGFVIRFAQIAPNWWWRFWQFVLLGWRWRNLTRDLLAQSPQAGENQ